MTDAEVREAVRAWDEAMVANDAEAIGAFMAEEWVIARGVSAGRFRGQPFRETEGGSNVFVRRDGQWRCVLTHLSTLVASEPIPTREPMSPA